MKSIIRLEPVFMYRMWGGRKLSEYFGYEIPYDKTGECWAISAHKNGDCVIQNEEFKGKTLSWLYNNHREYFGNIENKEFPLLVKLIDACNDLSVQVHPGDEYANSKENGQLGKTEAWYIIDCNEDSVLEYGHKAKTKEELIEYIHEGKWEELLEFRSIKKGDFFYLPSGTVHAICKNTLVYEIQQSSDITYRLYDYDRIDENTGKKRELHIKKSLEVIKAPFVVDNNSIPSVEVEEDSIKTQYINTKYFKTAKFDIKNNFIVKDKVLFSLVTVLEGKGTLDGEEIKKGDSFIIPYGYGDYEIKGDISLIVSSM